MFDVGPETYYQILTRVIGMGSRGYSFPRYNYRGWPHLVMNPLHGAAQP